MSHKKHLEHLLAQGYLVQAMNELLEATEQNGQQDLHQEVVRYSGHYHANEQRRLSLTTGDETYLLEFARINQAILTCLARYTDTGTYLYEPLEGEGGKPVLRYQLPQKPEFFLGRTSALQQIETTFASGKKLVLLHGVGGMGKTTLMQAYLHTPVCQQHFRRIGYISVKNDLMSAFLTGAVGALKIDRKQYPRDEELLRVVKNTMKQCDGPNLFVIDNINEADLDSLTDLKAHLAETGWQFLITTRTLPEDRDFAFVPVVELSPEEARLLFAYHYYYESGDPVWNAPEAVQIAALHTHLTNEPEIDLLTPLIEDHLNRHTLLVELAGKMGNFNAGMAIRELLALFQETDVRIKYTRQPFETEIDFDKHAASGGRMEKGKLDAYLLAMFDTDYLTESTGDDAQDLENDAKAEMLRFFSVLPPEDILIGDLKMLWQVGESNITPFESRLRYLRAAGWLQGRRQRAVGASQNLAYKMHPLVQDVVYLQLKPDINSVRPLVKTLTEMLALPPDRAHRFQPYAQSIIDKLLEWNARS